MSEHTEYKFKTKTKALKFQKNIKKTYGYVPSIFNNIYTKEYVVIKPDGLRKIPRWKKI